MVTEENFQKILDARTNQEGHRMYVIYVRDDGTCSCHGQLQDSTERWESPNLTEAVASMKRFAKTMNGVKIKKKSDITYLRYKPVTTVAWEPFHPFGEPKNRPFEKPQ